MSATEMQGRDGSELAAAGDDAPTVPQQVVESKPAPPMTPLDGVLIAEHEKHMPEGVGAVSEERWKWPWVAGGLGTVGLIVGAVVLGVTVNWMAAVVAIVWLLMGYAVAWSVVWGAGVMRSGDEAEAERKVDRGELPPPAVRVG